MRRVLWAVLAILFLMNLNAQAKAQTYPRGGMAAESPPYDESHFENAWMIGDSQTAPFDLMDHFPGMDIEHRIGMSLQLLNRSKAVKFEGNSLLVTEKIAQKNPSALYIWLGSNGLDYYPSEDILSHYETLLGAIRADFPELMVFCISATPVGPKAMERYSRYTPEKILKFNAGLLTLCKTYGAVYFDFHTLLVGEDGFLGREYAAGDGIHLTYGTYERLKGYILSHSSGAVIEEGGRQ